MRCSKGHHVPTGSSFCPACGEPTKAKGRTDEDLEKIIKKAVRAEREEWEEEQRKKREEEEEEEENDIEGQGSFL